MRRSGDIAERLARIEETMATREELDALRAEIERIGRSPRRRLATAAFWAAVGIGFAGLMAAVAGRVGIAS